MIKIVKVIKFKFEELDKVNVENRRVIGCEEGVLIDRIWMLIISILRKKLKDLMGEF